MRAKALTCNHEGAEAALEAAGPLESMPHRAKLTKRRGPGRPRLLEPPAESARLVVRLDARSEETLSALEDRWGVGRAAVARDLLTAWGDSAEVRRAVEAWRKERGA